MNRKDLERKPTKNFWNAGNAVVVSIVVLALLMPGYSVCANDVVLANTIVRFEPPSQTVEKGETFTASYYIEPTDWIMGANFVTISFDPTLLEVISPWVTEGDFFGGSAMMFEGGTIDNTLGTISDGYALVLPGDAINTRGSLYVIHFKAKNKLGTSALTMSGVEVKNNTGQNVPITVESGSVIVGEGSSVEWDVTLNFNEDGGKLDYVVFGESLDANDGEPSDSYDEPKPPAPQPPYLRAWLDDSLIIPYDFLLKDYRQYPDTNKTWDLYVHWISDSAPTNVTIFWDASEFNDCEYNSVVLWRYDPFDMEWDFAADMFVSNNYVYTPWWFNEQWLTDQFQIVATGGSWNNPPFFPSDPNPSNDATDVERPPTELSVNVEDPDGDIMDIDIVWINHDDVWITLETYLGVDNGTYNFIPPEINDWVWGNTTHVWSVNATDGTLWRNETYEYTTGGSRYDVNNNDLVNFQDAGLVWVHRTSEVAYEGIYDVNQDGQVNFQDAGLTWINRD